MRRMWVRDIFKRRSESRPSFDLEPEMAMGDQDMYFRYMRMSLTKMERLLSLIAPFVTKSNTNYRQSIFFSSYLFAA